MDFRKLIVLAAVVMVGVTAWAQDYPKFEVPVDFSYVHFVPAKHSGSANLWGGGGQFDYNFTKYIGIKADFQGYGTTNHNFTVTNSLGRTGTFNVQANMFTYMAGPQVKARGAHFQPFAEVLFGGAHSNTYANLFKSGFFLGGKAPSNNGFAMAAGGGIDYKITDHFTIRPVEFDFLLTRFGNPVTQNNNNQDNFRAQAGVVFTLGGKPPIPPTSACSVSPTEIMAGEPVAAKVTTQNFNPKHKIDYAWTTAGGKISPAGETANVDTAGLAPGSYMVKATATDEKQKKNNVTSCEASFVVKQPNPPTASCSASPTTIKAGDTSTVSVTASSLDGRPLTYSYSATAGKISGSGNTATLDSTSATPGSSITTTATVTDDRGLSTTCTAVLNVLAPPVTVVEATEAGECQFVNNPKKPWRVDNECKAVLDRVAIQLQQEPNGRVVVVGYTDEQEDVTLGPQRAVNVKYYLTSGEGQTQIDPARIEPRSISDKSKSAKMYFVPPGGNFTVEGTQTVDETQVKPSTTAPAPKKAKKKPATTN